MAVVADPRGGSGATGEIHDTKQNDLGTVRTFSDGFDYIYLQGVASTASGDWVVFFNDGTTERLHSSTARHGGVAIATAAVVANKFGWYGYAGAFTAVCESSIVSNAFCFAMTTAGRVDDAVIKNKMVWNAITRSAGAAGGTATVHINRPWLGNYIESA